MRGTPNSRFMNELDVICPTQPARLEETSMPFHSFCFARRKKFHEWNSQRVLAFAVRVELSITLV